MRKLSFMQKLRHKRQHVSSAGATLAPVDLLKHPLIHLEGPYDEQTRWSKWFTTLGIDMAKARPGITVNSYINLVQAALDGQGFALIGPPLIAAGPADLGAGGRGGARSADRSRVLRHGLHGQE
jgi:DNA-binding transcriptional LysR family regulator